MCFIIEKSRTVLPLTTKIEWSRQLLQIINAVQARSLGQYGKGVVYLILIPKNTGWYQEPLKMCLVLVVYLPSSELLPWKSFSQATKRRFMAEK